MLCASHANGKRCVQVDGWMLTMDGKAQIVEELGEQLLPGLVNQGLTANDQAKFLMTLLQAARDHADHPDLPGMDLTQERTACGVDDASFDTAIEQSVKVHAGKYRIPQVQSIHSQLVACIRHMLAPVVAAEQAHASDMRGQAAEYADRLDALVAGAPSLANETITCDAIDRITSAQPSERDSFHLLVMHLHKELNRLQQKIASESIEGASVYGIQQEDRPLVAAFMRGLNQTKPLKFDHPGLGTTATRSRGRLMLQNDIGTTDAHVLVVHVAGRAVSVTYTDVHIQRLMFFQNLFRRLGVQWEDTRSRRSAKLTEGLYHLCVGRYEAADSAALDEFLEFLGSRLVFLIDWNRARKRLRKLAPKRVCLEVLQWAADNDYGHMGFLKLGGEQLIFDALQLSPHLPLGLGGQLSDVLGAESIARFLKFALKTSSQGLQAGRSELLVRDEIRAELRHYLDTLHEALLELASEHATLIVELAMAARDNLLSPAAPCDKDSIQRTARRAQHWEHRADQLVSSARTAGARSAESKAAAELLRIADNAADELEEAIFLLTLLPLEGARDESYGALQLLADLLVKSAQEYLKAAENARHLTRDSSREQMDDFLEAVDRTISLEHQTDDAHRRAKTSILTFSGDFKQLHLFTGIADNLESAADALMLSALILKDYVFGEVISR